MHGAADLRQAFDLSYPHAPDGLSPQDPLGWAIIGQWSAMAETVEFSCRRRSDIQVGWILYLDAARHVDTQ